MFFFFFFNDTATTEIYTLSLHDALPICTGSTRTPTPPSCGARCWRGRARRRSPPATAAVTGTSTARGSTRRSEEHTSELQSRQYLVCRLLLEKKKKKLIM